MAFDQDLVTLSQIGINYCKNILQLDNRYIPVAHELERDLEQTGAYLKISPEEQDNWKSERQLHIEKQERNLQSSHGLKILTLNCGTRRPEKIDPLFFNLIRHMDVVLLQECCDAMMIYVEDVIRKVSCIEHKYSRSLAVFSNMPSAGGIAPSKYYFKGICYLELRSERNFPLVIANVHLDSEAYIDKKSLELKEVAAWAAEEKSKGKTIILAGDFNITYDQMHPDFKKSWQGRNYWAQEYNLALPFTYDSVVTKPTNLPVFHDPFYTHKPNLSYTHINNKQNKFRLDYILPDINNPFELPSKIKRYEILNTISLGFDHNAVFMEIDV
ncbi:hypothetical protein P4K96_04275 [Bacillus cereus]|nr:hypothetical protein [Bacillus cereus]